MVKEKIKKYNLFLLVVLVDLILWLYWPDKGITAVKSTGDYLLEMLLFIPPIFILIGLLDVWVPREIVEKNVGPDSGVKGVVISILVATAAAGPLYAGFPVIIISGYLVEKLLAGAKKAGTPEVNKILNKIYL